MPNVALKFGQHVSGRVFTVVMSVIVNDNAVEQKASRMQVFPVLDPWP